MNLLNTLTVKILQLDKSILDADMPNGGRWKYFEYEHNFQILIK